MTHVLKLLSTISSQYLNKWRKSEIYPLNSQPFCFLTLPEQKYLNCLAHNLKRKKKCQFSNRVNSIAYSINCVVWGMTYLQWVSHSKQHAYKPSKGKPTLGRGFYKMKAAQTPPLLSTRLLPVVLAVSPVPRSQCKSSRNNTESGNIFINQTLHKKWTRDLVNLTHFNSLWFNNQFYIL